jgi:hypothetical protein
MIDLSKIPVVSDEEAEQCDALICIPASWDAGPFAATNVRGTCSVCGIAVQHRPHAPKRPTRLCLPCAMEMGQAPRH